MESSNILATVPRGPDVLFDETRLGALVQTWQKDEDLQPAILAAVCQPLSDQKMLRKKAPHAVRHVLRLAGYLRGNNETPGFKLDDLRRDEWFHGNRRLLDVLTGDPRLLLKWLYWYFLNSNAEIGEGFMETAKMLAARAPGTTAASIKDQALEQLGRQGFGRSLLLFEATLRCLLPAWFTDVDASTLWSPAEVPAQEEPAAQAKIKWAPRVPQEKIRRLYQLNAAGTPDGDLMDDVGYGLYVRARDYIKVGRIHGSGVLVCPSCEGDIAINGHQIYACACGWSISGKDLHKTYQGKQYVGSSVVPFAEQFVREWEAAAGDYPAKMRAIDALMHGFHWELGEAGTTRPSAINFVEGRLDSIVQFILSLAYDNGTAAYNEQLDRWLASAKRSQWLRGLVENHKARFEQGVGGETPAHDTSTRPE